MWNDLVNSFVKSPVHLCLGCPVPDPGEGQALPGDQAKLGDHAADMASSSTGPALREALCATAHRCTGGETAQECGDR